MDFDHEPALNFIENLNYFVFVTKLPLLFIRKPYAFQIIVTWQIEIQIDNMDYTLRLQIDLEMTQTVLFLLMSLGYIQKKTPCQLTKYSGSCEEQQGKPSANSSVESSATRTRRSTHRTAYVNDRPAFTKCGYQTNPLPR